MRRLATAAVVVLCLGGGSWASTAWIRLPLTVAAACSVLLLLAESLSRLLVLAVRKQRRRYTRRDDGNTIVIPNADIQGADVKRLFGSADMMQKSAPGLRQLVRFWHAPNAEVHQETMDRNELYTLVKPVTSRILSSMPMDRVRQLARRHVDEAMRQQQAQRADWSIVRLRTLVGGICVSFCHEYALRRPCPPAVVPLLVASTADMAASIRSMSRRNMPLRMSALAYVRNLVEREGGRPDLFGDDCPLTLDQRARYLHGNWIHTASAQVMRLVCNAVAHLSRNPHCLAQVKREAQAGGCYAEGSYLDAVLTETERLTPGIVTTNRVAARDIVVNEKVTVPRGTNVIIDFTAYQLTGFERPEEFRPERWQHCDKREANYMPFGYGKQRCPAERFTLTAARELLLGLLGSLEFHFARGAGTFFAATPQVANDLCLLIRRPSLGRTGRWAVGWGLTGALAVESFYKGLLQLAITPKNAKEAFAEPVGEEHAPHTKVGSAAAH